MKVKAKFVKPNTCPNCGNINSKVPIGTIVEIEAGKTRKSFAGEYICINCGIDHPSKNEIYVNDVTGSGWSYADQWEIQEGVSECQTN